MEVTTMCTVLAAGVTRFTWRSPQDHGDGLLVDVDIASERWHEVADVLLWSTPVDPATAAARVAQSHAALAVVARQPGRWLVLTPRRVVVSAGDWPALLAVIVEHYRAVVSRRDVLTPPPGQPPGSA
jgi:hypothetical protein